jgi:hypoxanthine phosphoribosyltransferase
MDGPEQVGELVVSAEQIAARVEELAAQLSADYAGAVPVLVGALTGGFVFLADLVRRLTVAAEVDFVIARSYGRGVQSVGNVRIVWGPERDLSGRDVILVEDIVDTGLTAQRLVAHLRAGGARTVRVCALLDKPSGRRVEFAADYVGFEVPPAFVIGYGLDHAERHRGLPYVATLKR